jgi:hypothetical protein
MSLRLQQRIIYYINHSKKDMLSIEEIKQRLLKEERFELIPLLNTTIDQMLEKRILQIEKTEFVEYYSLI